MSLTTTPLHFAARTGRKQAAALLLARGAEPNARDVLGETPLDWAVLQGHETVANLLRQHGGFE